MDVMRIFDPILLVLAPLSPLLAQEKADAAKVEADKPDAANIDQLLKAQLTELQKLREEVDLQAGKIDKLTQQVAHWPTRLSRRLLLPLQLRELNRCQLQHRRHRLRHRRQQVSISRSRIRLISKRTSWRKGRH